MNNDLISREDLKKAFKIEELYWGKRIIDIIDNAPTITDHSRELVQKSIELGRKVGYLEGKIENKRPQGEWIDYDNTFYKCPDCGYLLEKCCPHCQNKVILPSGAKMDGGEE